MAKVVGVTVGVIVMAALTFFYAVLLAAVGGFGAPPSVVFDRIRHTPIPIMIPALWQLLWPLLVSLFISICCGLLASVIVAELQERFRAHHRN